MRQDVRSLDDKAGNRDDILFDIDVGMEELEGIMDSLMVRNLK